MAIILPDGGVYSNGSNKNGHENSGVNWLRTPEDGLTTRPITDETQSILLKSNLGRLGINATRSRVEGAVIPAFVVSISPEEVKKFRQEHSADEANQRGLLKTLNLGVIFPESRAR